MSRPWGRFAKRFFGERLGSVQYGPGCWECETEGMVWGVMVMVQLVRVRCGDDTRVLRPGTERAIPSHVMNQEEAKTACGVDTTPQRPWHARSPASRTQHGQATVSLTLLVDYIRSLARIY